MSARLCIGSDHGGYEQKCQLFQWLQSEGYDIVDKGCYSEESVDYPDFAAAVADEVVAGNAEFGILVCGTGIGISIAANKVKGIRAANVVTPQFAQLAREHNNANIVGLSGRFVDFETNKEIVRTFLATEHAGGRHARRVEKISKLEER